MHSPADLYRLYCLQGHHGGGKLRIEAVIPVCVGSQTGRNVVSDYLEDPADRIAGAQDSVNFSFHFLFSSSIGAIQKHVIAIIKRANLFLCRTRDRLWALSCASA